MVNIKNIKRGFAVGALSFGLLLSGGNYALASYKDVDSNNWYVNEITELTEKGIISGSNGNFMPKSNVTRAQASRIVWGAIENLELDKTMKPATKTKKFKDVEDDAWYANDVYNMQANKIINGYTDGTFKPSENLTKAQAVTILVNAFNVKPERNSIKIPFNDINEKHWAYNNITIAYNAGIITRGFDSSFNPNQNITREELISFTSKAMNWYENKNFSYEELVFDRLDRSQVPEGHKYPNTYKLMQEGLNNSESIIYFDKNELDYREIKELMYSDFYWGTPSKYFIQKWVAYSNGEIKVTYTDDTETTQKKMKMIDEKAEEVIREIIKPNFTDYDKIKAVHDYVVLNTAYDLERWNNGTAPPESSNIYGVLIDGIAVCDGYARTVSYLLDKLGIENYYVKGDLVKGGLHAWNLVNIDGEYYYLDSTWDDPTPNKEGRVIYKYFLIDEETLSKTHKIYEVIEEKELPRATSKKYLNK